MSKVTKADWAATTPWDGIQGKPATFTGGPVDVGSLKAAGFSVGTVPQWNGSKFVPVTLPSGSTVIVDGVTYEDVLLPWDPPVILPLQSCWEEFAVIGVSITDPIGLGAPYNVGDCLITAYVPDTNTVRITVQNISAGSVNLGYGLWRVRRFIEP